LYTEASTKHTSNSRASVVHASLFTLAGVPTTNPTTAKTRYRQREKNAAQAKIAPSYADSVYRSVKRSNKFRREPAAASYGDFRRSLYEVTIISMGKPSGIGENAQNAAF
jgi:hypothetical protein